MSRKNENTNFTCLYCNKAVMPLTNGSYRNHCPFCLYSLHVDVNIGDRKNACNGLMKPAGIEYNSKKGYQIIHVCCKCGASRLNKVAQCTQMPDDFDVVLRLFNI